MNMPVSPVEMWNKVSVWTSPERIYRLAPATEGNTLIIIRAVFQTGLTLGLGSTMIAAIFCHQLRTRLMRRENARGERC